ncbi:hypothetical protein Cpir12675_005725 [Ceratocystis pirilliformis]|uniref:Chromatin structure-remodeling complex subunit RSC1 n=1 Tax=Ceratocystis pirilliformis TaxID=259994 RepID=A0ABR3YNX6_9PEZI
MASTPGLAGDAPTASDPTSTDVAMKGAERPADVPSKILAHNAPPPNATANDNGSDVDADGGEDADGEVDDDANATGFDSAQSFKITQRNLLDVIHDTSAFLCDYKEEGEDEELAIGFQRIPNKRLLPSYFEVISTPIAFSTIRGKILKKQYTEFSQFVRDVAQICHNAQVFNRPSAGIFGAAVRLRELFISELNRMVEHGTIEAGDAKLPDLGELPSAEESSGGEEEEEEEEEESADEARVKRRKPNGETGKRRGRPPRVLTPTEARIIAIIKGIRRTEDSDGELLIEPFEKLPDRNTNPHYYQVIAQPICLEQIKRKAKRKKYRAVQDVLRDLTTMLTNSITYNEEGSEIHQAATKLLARVSELANEQTSKPDNSFLDDSGRLPLTEAMHNNATWRVGDWVHIHNPNEPTKPIVAQIFRMWMNNDKQTWINVCWYYRPEQTVHRYDKMFYPREVVKTGQFHVHRIEEIIDPCFVMFVGSYNRGRPRGLPADKIIYVCESRYNEEKFTFKKIKTWASCLPDEVRGKDYEIDFYPPGRTAMVKIISPITHLLPPDAKETDAMPKPNWGNPQAPPLIGAVHKRPRGSNESPPPLEPTISIPTQQPSPQNIPSTVYNSQAPIPPHGYHSSPAHLPMQMAPSNPGPPSQPPFMVAPGQQPVQYHGHSHPLAQPHPHPMTVQRPHQQPQPMMQPHFQPPMQHQMPPQMNSMSRPSSVSVPVSVPVPMPPAYQGIPGSQHPSRPMLPPNSTPNPGYQAQFLPQQFPPQMPPQSQPQPLQQQLPMQPRTPMPMAPAPVVAQSHPPPSRFEVYTLSDEANEKIPKSLSKNFHTDDQGRILFFATPPLARAHAGKSLHAAALGHSARYLSGREEWLEERERKRKARDKALKEKANKDRASRQAEVEEQTNQATDLTASIISKWCQANLQEASKMNASVHG